MSEVLEDVEEKKKQQKRFKKKKPKQQKRVVDVSTLTNKNVLREPAVQARTGLKTTALNDAIERGEFPAPFYPTESGRTRVWLEAEVDAWLTSRLAQRDAE
jgi:predicted DNA-binding transcriptional regulator AlpA